MNEIEKLYENAGIKKKPYCELNCSITKNDFECTSYCLHYEDEGLYYPSFTAEKQIEITKFLLKKAVYYDVKDDKYWFYYEECESVGYKPFEEAIAHFINNLWQDLTEEERKQIKEILE